MPTLQAGAIRSKFISYAQLAERQNKSVTTIWRQVKRQELPPPVRLSPGRVGWLVDVIEAWEQARWQEAIQRASGDVA